MSENSTVPRRYAYNNNRLFIEDITGAGGGDTNRQTSSSLPAIRDASSLAPINPYSATSIGFQRATPNSVSGSFDLTNTQNKLKQLESRLQVTEVSNRALLEELIRLQNDMALSLRRSFDTIAEERSARVALENNLKFQNDTFVQLTGRLKRAEDFLQEDRNAMQSLISFTRNFEQTSTNTIKDLFMRRDFQAQRLEDLRIQIDDLQRSKEGLERSAYTLLDEIKTLKTKVDIEAIAITSVSGDLSNKTKRLEDESRQHLEIMRKQQDSMSIAENNLFAVKSQLESRISEMRDMVVEVRNRVENDKEDRRRYDQNLANKFADLNAQLNEEKMRYNEAMRMIESSKREFYSSLENEKMRNSSLITENKDTTFLVMNDKIEKAKEDINTRIRDLEKVSK